MPLPHTECGVSQPPSPFLSLLPQHSWACPSPLHSEPFRLPSPPSPLPHRYPSTETVFEYFIDPKTRQWTSWESKLSASYKPPPDLPFFKVLVPTVDTVRNKYVAAALVRVFQHTLIVGNVGVGKTMIIQSLLDTLPSDRGSMVINFSAQTSSNSLQVWREGGGAGGREGGHWVEGARGGPGQGILILAGTLTSHFGLGQHPVEWVQGCALSGPPTFHLLVSPLTSLPVLVPSLLTGHDRGQA